MVQPSIESLEEGELPQEHVELFSRIKEAARVCMRDSMIQWQVGARLAFRLAYVVRRKRPC